MRVNGSDDSDSDRGVRRQGWPKCRLALLWQNYSCRCPLQIHFRQCGSLRWYSSEELEDGVTYGGQSWLRRGSVDSFFSALLLRDGDAAGRRKRSSS